MKNVLLTALVALLVFTMGACNTSVPTSQKDSVRESPVNDLPAKGAPNQATKTNAAQTPGGGGGGGGNAAPAIAYKASYQVQNNVQAPGIFVMNADGSSQTRVYSNVTGSGANRVIHNVDRPAWNAAGTKLCFTQDGADILTLSVNVSNGVASGSNPATVATGSAAGGNYGKGVWQPATTNIAAVLHRSTDPDLIKSIPTGGGSISNLYTAPSGYEIDDNISFNPNGTLLAFSTHNTSTGYYFLHVLELSTSTIIKTIDLSQFRSVTAVDWQKSAGSQVVAISTSQWCSINVNSYHEIYTLDLSAASPTPVSVLFDHDGCSWSSDDGQIATMTISGSICGGTPQCCTRLYNYGVSSYNLTTHTESTLGFNHGMNPDWKR